MHHQMWLVVYFLHFQPIPSLSLIIPIFFNVLLLDILSFVFSPSLSLSLYFQNLSFFIITHVHMNVMIHYLLLIGIVIITINQDLISSVKQAHGFRIFDTRRW